MPATAAAAVAVAAALDAAVAEPPSRAHPVALFGHLVAVVDRDVDGSESSGWTHPRIVGVAAAVILPVFAAAVATAAVLAGSHTHPWVGAAVAGLVLFSTTSLRALLDRAREVIAASGGDLDAARHSLRALAGRDASSLDAAHVRSAAVESLAENLADGWVAPLVAFGGVVGGGEFVGGVTVVGIDAGVALAAGAAAWVKAVNTMDSMLGYRSKPVGWAPARLDDVVMWLPARLSAGLLGAAAGTPGVPSRRRVRALARTPASPNSGWPMATMAAALPARLVKPGAYDLDPAGSETGSGGAAGGADNTTTLPDIATATRAVGVTRRAGVLAAAVTGGVVWF
ncbi:CobD/CbiB family cobalamin biosynthesis protein [Halobellus salinus]|uniref:CobD/CbiB family cobalamin biosynthesis protein n=1 Tax=Halobellus salinus TaxID=931585 RepID=UPI001669BB7B|nr:CobD/CbiB family cobalamin biosynthesis protein [Halobellus salinus]SMP03319.1 adenosylcobinamide-phosphate synthase [Halobellus salinus]